MPERTETQLNLPEVEPIASIFVPVPNYFLDNYTDLDPALEDIGRFIAHFVTDLVTLESDEEQDILASYMAKTYQKGWTDRLVNVGACFEGIRGLSLVYGTTMIEAKLLERYVEIYRRHYHLQYQGGMLRDFVEDLFACLEEDDSGLVKGYSMFILAGAYRLRALEVHYNYDWRERQCR